MEEGSIKIGTGGGKKRDLRGQKNLRIEAGIMSSKVGFQEGNTRNEGKDGVRESFKTNNVCKESEDRHNRGTKISFN